MKSILVIKTPKNCDDCQLMHSYFDNGYGWIKECIGSGENDCIVFKKKIEDYCPLKTPQKLDANDWHRLFDGEYKIREAKGVGYNFCIDEILGEE